MNVSETIVREYFELNEFLVRQHRKHIAQTKREEDDIDFFVFNPRPEPGSEPLPFVLTSPDIRSISRAIVVVKGWHTGRFSSSRLTGTPEIFRFVGTRVFQQAARVFGENGNPLKILVIPSLPSTESARNESIALLRSRGVDAIIPFRTILSDLVERVEINRNYQKSDVLQVLRILKNYEFFKEPQLDLFKPRRSRKSR